MPITTTKSVTGVRYLWADNRIVDILRLDRTYTRDNRGRFASGGGGGGGSSGGGKSGGGKKGGGGGLASMKASELQKIASDEGIDINTLSHKRRKSVLAAAIEAKRKGKDLREEGLLKAQKPQSSLAKKRSQSKGKGKKEESISDRVKQVKAANKRSQPQKTERLSTEDIINSKTAPPKPKALEQKERQELDQYNNELAQIVDTGGSGQMSQKDLQALKKMGIAEPEASIWIRTENLLDASSPSKIKDALQGDALHYANGDQSGRYKELYSRTIADKLSSLGNKDLAELSGKFYSSRIKAGEPLKASKIKNAPPVLAGELRRRKMLDIDTKGEYKGKRFLPTEWGKLSDKDFTFD